MTEPLSSKRITCDPGVLCGIPCIRGMPVAVKSLIGMLNSGIPQEEILSDYPYLEAEDLAAAINYAATQMPTTDASGKPIVQKPRPNHQRTLGILRSMTPQQKLAQVFKLNERTLNLFRSGLKRRYPHLDDIEFEKLYLQMRARCHNRIY